MKHPLTRRQTRALFKSIQHWKRIAKGKAYSNGTETCALCQEFLCSEFYGDDCRKCPVAEKTGEEYCDGTPFPEFTKVAHTDEAGFRWALGKPAQAAAEKEVKFLKSIWKDRASMSLREYADLCD